MNYVLVQNFAASLQVMTVQLVLENIPLFHSSVFKIIHSFLYATPLPLSVSVSLLPTIGTFCLGMLFSVP